MNNQLNASEITVGTQLAEWDGFLWDVTEIVSTTPLTITARLNSDFSSRRQHWTGNKGVLKTFRRSERLSGILPA